MPRTQFAFLLLWIALLALGSAAFFRGDFGSGELRGELEDLEERQRSDRRALLEQMSLAFTQTLSANTALNGTPEITRAPAPVDGVRENELLARLGALEQAVHEMQDLLQRNELGEEDFLAHPFLPEAFTQTAALDEKALMRKFYGWDYRRVLAEFGAPAEARLTGNHQNVQWLYSVPPESFQFIFHDGRVALINRSEQ